MKVRVELIREEEGGFLGVCPELPGCQSSGETEAEALECIHEAIELYLQPTHPAMPGAKQHGPRRLQGRRASFSDQLRR